MEPFDVSLWENREIIIAVLLGFGFGFALDKAGMTRYHKIVNVYRFTDLAVLKFMLSAMVTGMIGVYALHWAGEIELSAATSTIPFKALAGGLLFGVGMSLIGMCPGTAVAGAGRGQLDYLIPGIGGMLTGALAYGFLYPRIADFFADSPNYGTDKLPQLWDLSPLLAVYVFAQMMLLVLYLVARLNVRRRDRINETA